MNNTRRIEEILKTEGMLVSTTVGISMYPMLRNRRDTVIIKPYEGRLKKYDVPLYKANSKYTLHRIIEVRPDSYVIRGDNCDRKEYGITDEQILGVLVGFYRGDKQVDMDGWKYKAYVRIHCRLFPVRWLYRRARAVAGKAWHAIMKGDRKT